MNRLGGGWRDGPVEGKFVSDCKSDSESEKIRFLGSFNVWKRRAMLNSGITFK